MIDTCAVELAEEIWAESVCRPDEPGRWRIGYYDHKGASYVSAVGHGAHAWGKAFMRAVKSGAHVSVENGPYVSLLYARVADPYGDSEREVENVEMAVVTGNDFLCFRDGCPA